MRYDNFKYNESTYSPLDDTYGIFKYGENKYHAEPTLCYGVLLNINSPIEFNGRVRYGSNTPYGGLQLLKLYKVNNYLIIQ
jgi:hypothetical protein